MALKVVFPRYSCGYKRHTIIGPTGIFHTMTAPGLKSGDVLAASSRRTMRTNRERQRTRVFRGAIHGLHHFNTTVEVPGQTRENVEYEQSDTVRLSKVRQ